MLCQSRRRAEAYARATSSSCRQRAAWVEGQAVDAVEVTTEVARAKKHPGFCQGALGFLGFDGISIDNFRICNKKIGIPIENSGFRGLGFLWKLHVDVLLL